MSILFERKYHIMGSISPTVKGIIAIMLTLLVVIIVIMIFVKSLFINDDSKPKKTGTITSTEYIPTQTTTTTTQEETKKKKTTVDDEDEDPYSNEGDAIGDITCTGAVYLHPEPSSKSENLATIPSGTVCKFYREENGWYYVDYNGQKGYAWKDFFSAPPTA